LVEPLVPLTLAEFEFALSAAEAAYHGKLVPKDYWSRPAVTLVDGDVEQDVYLTTIPKMRALMAGGQAFGDDRSRANSFRWRFLSLGAILRHRRFRDYVRGEMVHDALMTAVARAPMHMAMSSRQIVASVAATLRHAPARPPG
jgi:hypothetical protein